MAIYLRTDPCSLLVYFRIAHNLKMREASPLHFSHSDSFLAYNLMFQRMII